MTLRELYEAWRTANDRYETLSMQNTVGLTLDQAFALDVAWRRAQQAVFKAALAYNEVLAKGDEP